MSKIQVKAKIAAAIKEQGNQIDCGSSLATILNDIISLKSGGYIKEITYSSTAVDENENIYLLTNTQSEIDEIIENLEALEIVKLTTTFNGYKAIFDKFVKYNGYWYGNFTVNATDEASGVMAILTPFYLNIRLSNTAGESYVEQYIEDE